MESDALGFLLGGLVSVVSVAAGVLGTVTVETMRGDREDKAAEKARLRDALYALQDAMTEAEHANILDDGYVRHLTQARAMSVRVGDERLDKRVQKWTDQFVLYVDKKKAYEEGVGDKPTTQEVLDLHNTMSAIQATIKRLLHGKPATYVRYKIRKKDDGSSALDTTPAEESGADDEAEPETRSATDEDVESRKES